ncbi:MAG: helix-turn-helix domain-containing protein [Actinomycetes bacterium]
MERRISQTQMAQLMSMSQQAFSRRTTGRVAFSLDEISQLAEILRVSEAFLLGFGNEASPRPMDEGLGAVRHQGLEPRTR